MHRPTPHLLRRRLVLIECWIIRRHLLVGRHEIPPSCGSRYQTTQHELLQFRLPSKEMVRKCFVFSTVNNSVAFRRFSTPTQRSMEPVNQRTAANSRRNPLFSDPINGRAATDISRESLPPPEPMRWKAYRAKPSRSRSHDAIILEVYGARGDPKTFGGFSGLAAFWGKALSQPTREISGTRQPVVSAASQATCAGGESARGGNRGFRWTT